MTDGRGAGSPVATRARSVEIGRRLAALVPGGAHTYAKGDDQYPEAMGPIIERGAGSRVWDVDGNEYIGFGAGLRAVTLGHADPRVIAAAVAAMRRALEDGVDGHLRGRPVRPVLRPYA